MHGKLFECDNYQILEDDLNNMYSSSFQVMVRGFVRWLYFYSSCLVCVWRSFFFFAVVFNHVKRCHHFMTNVPLGMVHALTFDFFLIIKNGYYTCLEVFSNLSYFFFISAVELAFGKVKLLDCQSREKLKGSALNFCLSEVTY